MKRKGKERGGCENKRGLCIGDCLGLWWLGVGYGYC